MRLHFDVNNNVEMPELIIGKKNYDKLGAITNVVDLSYDYYLMSANTISFTVHKIVDGMECTYWEQIRDKRLVYLKEFNEWFEIAVNIEESTDSVKNVTGKALCETELGQINIINTEINTEDDIARDDYEITKFYNPSTPSASLLHRLLKKAPNYTIKYVDKQLWDLQRSFSIDGVTIYDELVGEISEEFGCLFLFDSTDRSISVYDLKTNCRHCGNRDDFTDICPKCGSNDLDYGYGYDTSILVDRENLAENVTLEGKSDEVKNYFRVIGGDDVITAAVAACNPTGTNYFYTFSEDDKEDMSSSLSTKLDEYNELLASTTPLYQDLMQELYDVIDKQLYLESEMMPDITVAETTAEKELAKLTNGNLSPVAVTDVSVVSVFTANNAVLSMAKCIINSTIYKVSIVDSSLTSQTWKGKFRLVNNDDETDTAENTNYITVTINDDYAYYVEQQIKKVIDRDDIYLVDIFDKETTIDEFKAELKKYCIARLSSFESAYQSIINVLTEANCANDSTYGDIYNDLYMPYYNKLLAIQSELKVREAELEIVDNKYDELIRSQQEIQARLNLENYLGDTLWKELCSFRREDTYENTNYISDGLDNSEIFKKAEELLEVAKKEAITASTLQYTLSATMHNLLAMPEFQLLSAKFEGGNWIRVMVDEKVYRLRLIHYTINFSFFQTLNVEFSDVTQTTNGLNDLKSLSEKVNSMATNFNYVAHQAEQGEKSFSVVEQIKNDGLNTALYNISNAINQQFKIDKHGFLGRKWDDITGDYLPKQIKIINNLLAYTDDYWQTVKMAVGDINYYDPIRKINVSEYGVISDAIVSGKVISSEMIGGDIYSSNYVKDGSVGSHLRLTTGDFSFAGGRLKYDSEKDDLNLTGKITFEDVDYVDDSAKNSIRASLGITDVEKDIEEFNNSSILTPMEKKDMLDDWTVIQAEYKKNIELANAFEVSSNSVVVAYTNAYNTLATQILTCGLDDLTSSTSIDTRIYNDINNYHSANIAFANLINQEAKRLSEQALTDAKAYSKEEIEKLQTNVNKELSELNTELSDTKEYVDGAFYDNIISESEAASIQKYINSLKNEKADIDSRYVAVYNNTSIPSSFKSSLKTAKNNFDNSHNKLLQLINTAISTLQDSTKSQSEKQISVTNMNNGFTDYQNKLSALSSAFESAIDSISTNKLDSFINGNYKNFVQDIQNQVDEKSNTYYQPSQPYENHLNVADNTEYNKLIGDLWYDSDETSKKTYVYTKSTNGSNYNYQWTEMEVPAEIFDLADGKSQIFTSKPNDYKKNDLWLVGKDYVPSISGVKEGYVLVSVKDSSSYTESDWTLSIKYTDDTIAMQAISDNIITPAEKRDIYIEFKNITSTYNKYIAIISVSGSSYANIDITAYKKSYTNLGNVINFCGINEADMSKTTTLNSNDVTEFKSAFSTYYTEEAAIAKAIQDFSDEDIKDAQDAANQAQEDASKALDLLSEIASDEKITPSEKIQLKNKYLEIQTTYKKLTEKYTPAEYGDIESYQNLQFSYEDLCMMLDTILADMNSTFDLSQGSIIKDDLNSAFSYYYKDYQAFTNYIMTEVEDDISHVTTLAEEAKEYGSKLSTYLGLTTEITSDYIISPYIGGGYLKITDENNGSVVIDPIGITKSSYIFGIYNNADTLVMGVDNNGNGYFNGEITSTSGSIGGWNINSASIYRNSSKFGAAGGMYFGISGLSISNRFKVNSAGTLTSGTSTEYITLDKGSLKFYTNGNAIASFSDNVWSGTSTYGAVVHVEKDGYFVSFGRNNSSGSYETSFLINYGLNPSNRTEDVIVYGDILATRSYVSDYRYCFANNGVLITSGKVNAWGGTSWGINNDQTGTGLYVFGNIGCSGAKERIIQTKHYGAIELTAYETATPYFGDIGSAQCDEFGLCYIYIDEIFKEVILSECKYYVFLQQQGESPVYLIEKNTDYFVVKGKPYQEFDFEIKARQAGTENMRLDRSEDIIESEA